MPTMHMEQLLLNILTHSQKGDGGLGLLQVIASELSRVMLIAIEVAVEYWLALTWSPQAQWLSEVSKSGIIQDEVPPCLRQFSPAILCKSKIPIIDYLHVAQGQPFWCRKDWMGWDGMQVRSESKKVWKFIIEREIEAPARFQAIQTHRAVMAILQQQVCVC